MNTYSGARLTLGSPPSPTHGLHMAHPALPSLRWCQLWHFSKTQDAPTRLTEHWVCNEYKFSCLLYTYSIRFHRWGIMVPPVMVWVGRKSVYSGQLLRLGTLPLPPPSVLFTRSHILRLGVVRANTEVILRPLSDMQEGNSDRMCMSVWQPPHRHHIHIGTITQPGSGRGSGHRAGVEAARITLVAREVR